MFRLHKPSKSTKGFSLVELLVVMLIMAVIAGIATPIYLNQKTRAQRSIAENAGHVLLDALTSQLLGATSFGTTNGTIVIDNSVSPANVTVTLGSGATSPAVFTEGLTAGVTASGITYANTTQWCLDVVNNGQHVIYTDAGITSAQTSCGSTPGTNGVGGGPFPVVTGGTLASDATYYYRTFSSTGTLSISGGSLSVDVLTVAGGGGGGGYAGGGGGAGGLVYSAGQTLASGVTYTATVGAGGTAMGPAASPFPGNGGNSSFTGGSLALTVAVGGGRGAVGGGNGNYAAAVGGSGGGGGSGSQVTGAAGTASQGFAGGNSPGAGGNYVNGGGGGAGGAGGTPASLTANSGTGGVGTSAYSAWGLATGFGYNQGGTYYFAGGGGGAKSNNAAPTVSAVGPGGFGGGGFGGAMDSTGAGVVAPAAGLANTGGGGGGGTLVGPINTTGGVAGGSGIVIIRYTRASVGG